LDALKQKNSNQTFCNILTMNNDYFGATGNLWGYPFHMFNNQIFTDKQIEVPQIK